MSPCTRVISGETATLTAPSQEAERASSLILRAGHLRGRGHGLRWLIPALVADAAGSQPLSDKFLLLLRLLRSCGGKRAHVRSGVQSDTQQYA